MDTRNTVIERLKREREELNKKIVALKNALESHNDYGISLTQKELLEKQLSAMELYEFVLGIRISDLKGE